MSIPLPPPIIQQNKQPKKKWVIQEESNDVWKLDSKTASTV